jgi:hypothetical protein
MLGDVGLSGVFKVGRRVSILQRMGGIHMIRPSH